MPEVSVLNSIGTVVHNAPDKAVSVLNSLGTVVHDVPATLDAVSVLNSFGTVVHDVPPPLFAVSVQNMFGTIVHNTGSAAPPITPASNPTVKLVEANGTGYVLNTYSVDLLSVQRSRTSEQIPFKLGTKGKQSLRLRTNTEFTGSS